MKAAKVSGPATFAATLKPRSVRLQAELWQVRRDPSDEDAIHDARVAARRVLAAGDLWAPGEKGWAVLRERIAKIVKRLGRVRNLDVTIDLLGSDPRLSGVAPARLAKLLRKERRKERRRLAGWLTGRRIRSVAGAAELEAGPHVPSPQDLAPHFERLGKLKASLGREAVEAGHEARRELRRLRYGHETLEWAYGREKFRGALRRLKQIQDLAGRWHDLCILGDLAGESLEHRKGSGDLERLLAGVRRESAALVPKYARALGELLARQPELTEP